MAVLGIDENGLGPWMGPLVVTGVVADADAPFPESKQVFKRSVESYARGESLALALLERASGARPKTFGEIFDRFVKSDIERLCPKVGGRPLGPRMCFASARVPAWADGTAAESWPLAVREVLVFVACPKLYNHMVRKFQNKLFVDFTLFCDAIERAAGPFDSVVCGNIGYTRHYAPFFIADGRFRIADVREEGPRQSRYKLRGKRGDFEACFEIDADEKFGVVGAASIVGKYVREMMMRSLSKFFERGGDIPAVTGYGKREAYASEFGKTAEVPGECLLRER